jgi:hypothetical protein
MWEILTLIGDLCCVDFIKPFGFVSGVRGRD